MSAPLEMDKLHRLAQLTTWMRGLGCCQMCAVGMGLACVEKEHGESFDWRPIRGQCLTPPATRRGFTGPTCEARVREQWAERPRAPAQKVAA